MWKLFLYASFVEKSLLNLDTDFSQDQTKLCLPFVGTEIVTPQYENCDETPYRIKGVIITPSNAVWNVKTV